MSEKSTNVNTPKPQKFGTFLGVYTPSILTILGLIMYLRVGWVVGNVGLGLTIVIVLIASSITFITGLSASAIATNIQVGVGGEYFLVSRSLGLEMGGAIGIPLYLCRTLSVTFYCFGLSEAILVFVPDVPDYGIQLLAAVFIIAVTALSGKSAGLVLKSQIPIMMLVGLSIIALAIGVFTNDLRAPIMTAEYSTAPGGFWYVFAVFFPAVTGFTAGIGMSGDLRNPRKSIPRGTLGAVLSGAAIYLLIPLILSVTALLSLEQLADPDAGLKTWTEVALFGSILVIPAVWGAILSSAFGSILGGPRVLQALSQDGLAPKYFSKLSKTGQPTIATWVSGLIALAAVALGELNTVAQFVSILFLTLYVTINSSAAIEQLVNEPSYRPQIRVPWYISLLGAAGAIWVMYLFNPIACIVALLLVAALYIWLRSRSLEQQWGDVAAGFWMNITRYGMIQLNKRKIHPRNWRPLIILFVRDIHKRIQLVRFAENLGQNHGILTVAKLVQSNELISAEHRREIEIEMAKALEDHALDAFCEVHQVEELHQGVLEVSKAHGLGDLRTNTVLFGWSEELEGQLKAVTLIRDLCIIGKNVLLTSFNQELPEQVNSIDIWWGGRENNGDLMLLLAYLLKLNQHWDKALITIRSVVTTDEQKTKVDRGIREMLPMARIQAAVEVIVNSRAFAEILHQKSKNSDLVMLGLPVPQAGQEMQTVQAMNRTISGLRAVVFVKNNEMSDSIPILLRV